MSGPGGDRRRAALGVLAIALALAAVYGGTLGYPLVFDDEGFILRNPLLAGGLSWEGARRALLGSYLANWHPVTWASHMLDAGLFGAAPAPMRAQNVLLHAAAAGTLLLLLRALTGALWPSVFAAALFALHPLRVESVVWVSERKDALSALLALLAAAAWLRYQRRRRAGPYLASLGLFALALATKQTVVVLPPLLLLLAYWPLDRFRGPAPARRRALARTLGELLPFAALAAAAAAAAYLAQREIGALQTLASLPPGVRLGNAAVSGVWYIARTLWPAGLAVYYPHPEAALPVARAWAAALLLAAVTLLAVRGARTRPALAAGWLWYLLALLPVIGLVQAGAQARADRFSYLPSIGLALLLAWGIADLTRRLPRRARLLAPAALGALALLAAAARAQTRWWSSELVLYDRAIAVTARNWLALSNRGVARERAGDLAGAEADYREAIRLRPHYDDAHRHLGMLLVRKGRLAEGLGLLERAVVLSLGNAGRLVDLGEALLAAGRPADAEARLRQALALEPASVPARVNLSAALARQGRLAEAEALLRALAREEPGLAVARMNLGNVLAEQGRPEEALAQLRHALRLAPGSAEARFNLGLTLERSGRREEALREYREALRLEPGHAGAAAGAARLAAP